MHNSCQAWGAPGELKGGRLELHKQNSFYARLVLSSTLGFALAVLQSLCELCRRGGAASALSDVGAACAGFSWAGLPRLCSGHWCFSQCHWEGPGMAGKEKSGSFPHLVAVAYPETEILTELC